MNYALDALWWRLVSPAVRDLASLLTAPPLWHSGAELPVRMLLGEQGFRFLLALDGKPEPLQRFLERGFHGGRLGVYAETLLAFWFSHAPHCKLHARNFTVSGAEGQTVGAADFIVSVNDTVCHIEATCKYYGAPSGRPDVLCGLNPADTLPGKVEKLQRQLALFDGREGRDALKMLRLGQRLRPFSLVRGMGFCAPGLRLAQAPLNPYGWHGMYVADWQDYVAAPEGVYCLLPRTGYLAPARVGGEQVFGADALYGISDGLVAVLEYRDDGMWHETARIMKTARADGAAAV